MTTEEQRAISEFKAEMGKEGLELEITAKTEMLETSEMLWKKIMAKKAVNDIHALYLADLLDETDLEIIWLKHHIRKAKKALEMSEDERINLEMIEQAKRYPICQLIKCRKNMALCINHDERRPSMSVKNNKAHCFSCGWSGDSIDVYMKINGADFKTAVRSLQ